MKVRVMWPGKTRNQAAGSLEKIYLEKINHLGRCEVFVTRTTKGISEKESEVIKKVEADGMEQHLRRGSEYIVCLSDGGRQMNSREFADLLADIPLRYSKGITFLVGGFLGLHQNLMKKADLVLSLSRMTFSHELSRIMLLEQIYRSMSVLKGRKYAK